MVETGVSRVTLLRCFMRIRTGQTPIPQFQSPMDVALGEAALTNSDTDVTFSGVEGLGCGAVLSDRLLNGYNLQNLTN